jgi:hypothetical protein
LEIRINGEPLSFALEEERTLGEVVRSLERWLQASQLVICALRCGGRELLDLPEGEWSATPHSQVERLEVTARHASELRQANLETLREYLQAVRRFASSPDASCAEELREGHPLFVDSLKHHFSEAEVGGELADLSPLAAGSAGPDPESRRSLAAAAEALEQRIEARLRELEDPRSALRALSGELAAAAAGISEVSVLLATGRDRQAMEAILRFSDLSQRLLGVLRAAPAAQLGGLEPRAFFEELNRVLRELIDALQARDTVLIGDLLEYEVAPRLRRLEAAL